MSHKGFIIGGTHSGCGKTTITMALIAALKNRGLAIQPWKCGPDYIDPGFHSRASGKICRNLDTMILTDSVVKEIFFRQEGDISIVEGVMGLFDGAGGRDERGSAAHLSKLLGMPVILVIDAKAMARSAAAIAFGFKEFDKDVKIAGFIVNRVGSQRHFKMLKESIEDKTNLPVLGFLSRDDEISIPERHLGLFSHDLNENLDHIIGRLAQKMEENMDLESVLQIAETCTLGDETICQVFTEDFKKEPFLKIAVARDSAFRFYYEDNLDLLRHMGAQIEYFSPLNDSQLPRDISAIYFGGGYPESYGKELSLNLTLLNEIRTLSLESLPIYGECGGFMYLTEGIFLENDEFCKLVNILPGKARLGKKLRSLGYCESQVNSDSIVGKKGTKTKGHVFHWSELEGLSGREDKIFTVKKGDKTLEEGFSFKNVVGSWVHHHFASNPNMAASFMKAAENYRNNHE